MPWLDAIWDHGEGGNVEHVAEHGLTPEEVEHVLQNPAEHDTSRGTGRPLVKGWTRSGRWIVVIYEEVAPFTVMPITAYDDEG